MVAVEWALSPIGTGVSLDEDLSIFVIDVASCAAGTPSFDVVALEAAGRFVLTVSLIVVDLVAIVVVGWWWWIGGGGRLNF